MANLISEMLDYDELTSADELTLDDLDDLNRLLPQLSKSAPILKLARIAKILAGNTRIFIARANGEIVGVTLLCRTELLVGTKDWIEDVVVDEDFRQRGLFRHATSDKFPVDHIPPRSDIIVAFVFII